MRGQLARSANRVWKCVVGPHDSRCESWGFSQARPGKNKRSRPISRVLSWTVIPLGASSPIRSSNLPGDTAGRGIASLFGLAPGGVCRAGPLPDSRCALTAPFHPYHAFRLAFRRSWSTQPDIRPTSAPKNRSAVSFCCTFRRLAPPRGYLAPCPVEPGLSSASGSGEHDDATAWPTPPQALSHGRGPRAAMLFMDMRSSAGCGSCAFR